MTQKLQRLLLILGDQLDRASPLLADFAPASDALWMAEVTRESTKVWSHRQRTALFLSAMRHFRDEQRGLGRTVHYRSLDDERPASALGEALRADLQRLKPARILVVEPGEWGVRQELAEACHTFGHTLEIIEDTHFLSSVEDFEAHAQGRKSLRMEFFYRELRRKHNVLMENGKPAGGEWNYDAENRESFGRDGPRGLPRPRLFPPDKTTRDVFATVERHFPKHPGSLESFGWPVTPGEARLALDDFIENRLPRFGPHQDAMWEGEAWLWHSRLSSSLNLKLLHPREVVLAAENAWREGRASLPSVEGFIRQILGWREYVRGIYWLHMPGYLERNALGSSQELPAFYWTAETPMACLRDTISLTLKNGYAHHIQRLMVTGLYALLLGVRPQRVHEWYLAVYVDAVEWVELPNTLGMSQFGDGGIMASKPYVASGKYIERMSNHCRKCPFNPAEAAGPKACPFTTLYWDFLDRHADLLTRNPRTGQQVRNLLLKSEEERAAIRQRAAWIRTQEGNPPAPADPNGKTTQPGLFAD